MPALLTTASMRPKWSSAACTIFRAEPQAATDSVQFSATPPFCSISALVCWAGEADPPAWNTPHRPAQGLVRLLQARTLRACVLWIRVEVCGGKRYGETGFFVEPTVLDGTSDKMRVYQEEIFGPVVTVMPFKEVDDELIRRANDTVYGLAAGLWTSNIKRAHRIANQLRAGTVWVNCYNIFDAAMAAVVIAAPFLARVA